VARPETAFLRTLYDALREDAEREIQLTLKVALAVEHGMRIDDIAALGIPRGDALAAAKRAKWARDQLEQGHSPGPGG
jgi:hypothetical protein